MKPINKYPCYGEKITFVLFDPITGDSAFMISAGGNGGWAWVKEYLGYILDIVKMFTGSFFKRLTDVYDRIVDFLDLINECEKNIWQAIGMLFLVTYLFAMITLALVLSLTPLGLVVRTGIIMLVGTFLAEAMVWIRKRCE